MDKQTKYEITSLILMAVVVTLTIGYSLLSSNLNINGSSSIKEASWDIHFENIQVKTGSVSASTPVIDTNKTTVTYNVTLTNPGDYYEFTVDVKNAGSIDGMIESVSSRLNGAEISTLPNYLEYSVTYNDDRGIYSKQKLSSNAKETYKIHIGYKKDVVASDLPTSDQNLALSFTANFTQADSTAQARLLYYIPSPLSSTPAEITEDKSATNGESMYLELSQGNGSVVQTDVALNVNNNKYVIYGVDGEEYFSKNKNTLSGLCNSISGTYTTATNEVHCQKSGMIWVSLENDGTFVVSYQAIYCRLNTDRSYMCEGDIMPG